jgi:hypothetical protein
MIDHLENENEAGAIAGSPSSPSTRFGAARSTRPTESAPSPSHAPSPGNCSRCGHATEPDQYPDLFTYYCRNCGHRARVGEPDSPARAASPAETQSAEWRRAHGFPA